MKMFLFSILFFLMNFAASNAQVAVITNKKVPVDTLERADILNFYVLDIKSWSDGVSIVVFDLKPKGKVKEAFYDFLGKSTSRMKSIWMKKLLSGEGNPPEALNSEDDMLEKIAATPGAIGFVSKKKTDSTVKVLLLIEEK